MRVDEEFPAAWGRTLVGEVAFDAEDDEWIFSDWMEITFPSAEDGRHGHHTTGHEVPDTVAIAFDGEIIALGETGGMHLSNLYVHDAEYYQFLRLREVLDPERWASLPWAPFRNGQLLFAWDKFDAKDYFRHPERPPVACGYADPSQPDHPAVMTYGGDWYDLAQQVEHKYPLGYRAEPVVSSEACLIRAAQDGDVAAVQEQLALGTNPNIGEEPPGVHTSFCVERGETPIVSALNGRSPEMTDALVAAGARIPASLAYLYRPAPTEALPRTDPPRSGTSTRLETRSENGFRRWWRRIAGR